MTHTEAMHSIVSAITRIQEKSGDEVPDLRSDTVVINGVAGFDSLRGLELSVAMCRFFEIPEDINICISDDGRRPLTVAEIATKLMTMGQNPREKE
jgi:hypothetical protein